MDPQPKHPPGLTEALRRLGAMLLGTVQTRLELLAVEWSEERQKFLATLAWTAATLFTAMLAVIMSTLAAVALCPAKSRAVVLVLFALAYTAAAVWTASVLRRKVKERKPPFTATIGELKKDVESLRGGS